MKLSTFIHFSRRIASRAVLTMLFCHLPAIARAGEYYTYASVYSYTSTSSARSYTGISTSYSVQAVNRYNCSVALFQVSVPSDVSITCECSNYSSASTCYLRAKVYGSDPRLSSAPSSIMEVSDFRTDKFEIPFYNAANHPYGKTYWVMVYNVPQSLTSYSGTFSASFDLRFYRTGSSGGNGGGSDNYDFVFDAQGGSKAAMVLNGSAISETYYEDCIDWITIEQPWPLYSGTVYVKAASNTMAKPRYGSIQIVLYSGTSQTFSIMQKGNTSISTTQTVSFDANGGSIESEETVYVIGGKYSYLPDAAREGYSFAGWWTSSSGGTQITASSTVSSAATRTLYAHWTANSYTVTYLYDGGTKGSNNPESATYGTSFYVSAPSKSGSTFAGWTITDGLNSSTAKWGTSSSPATAISSSSTKCVNGASGNVYFKNLRSTSGSVTLKANWTPNAATTYTITYKPGSNGSGSQQTATKTKDVALALKGAVFTRTGYTQTGWATSDGGAKAYNLSASYTANAAATLYPFWTANTYTITYNYDGGTKGANTPASGTYETAFYVSAPTKSGSTFAGWTVTSGLDSSTAKWGTSSSPSTTISSSSTMCVNGASGNVYFKNLRSTSGSVTLKANWTAIDGKVPTLTVNSSGVLTAVSLNGASSVDIPSSVTRIDDKAFEGLDGLKSVTIPDSVTSIGGWAFLDCANLASVTIPAGVRVIEECPFLRCSRLSSIKVAGGNSHFRVVDGALIDLDNKTVVQYAPARSGSCVVPSNVSKIGWAAFSNSKIESVTLPESLSRIDAWAFSECSRLVSIVFLGNAPSLDQSGGSGSAFRSVAASCVATVPPGSTGWGVDIPGTWQGLSIVHPSPVQPKPATYTVKFNANGGTLPKGKTMAAQTLTCGKAAALRKNGFVRSGHVFVGWAKSKTGAVAYTNAKSVKNLAAAGKTVTLYAVWAKKTYKVKFVANGGKGKMAKQTFTYGKAKKLSANKFKAPKGKSFAGWATSKANARKGNVKYKNKKAVKNLVTTGKTVKLYAVWKGKPSLDSAIPSKPGSLHFATGGSAKWKTTTSDCLTGGASAVSGVVSINRESWLRTTVSGPGCISFWWKGTGENGQGCSFYVDGDYRAWIHGDNLSGADEFGNGFKWVEKAANGWNKVSVRVTGGGAHTLKWSYERWAGSPSSRYYLDDVSWTPKR